MAVAVWGERISLLLNLFKVLIKGYLQLYDIICAVRLLCASNWGAAMFTPTAVCVSEKFENRNGER
jgi:hypothetical protein